MSNRVPLPAGVTLGKSFEHGADVNLGTYANPIWQPIRRLFGLDRTPAPQTASAQTYDDLGAPNDEVTGWSISLAFSLLVNRSLTTGLYLPEIEALEARIGTGSTGDAAVVDVRWYHKPETGKPNPNDAGRGLFTVSRSRSNTGPEGANETFAYTLTGKGEYERIPNPFPGWGVTAPILGNIVPELAGDNDLVTLNGSGLLGATSVTVDGDPVEFLPISGATIALQMPAGDAGAVPVVVTTPGGVSAPLVYTRGA
ncbi:hypothetical protein C5B92_07060 [Rathayibacter sp. AY1A4]|uniref:IPT/TIG domain-containing protein n=1 Tax=Rathayibacter sp. AY1A4 TaxID=2080522 RepID=UPI000CE80565|nr:IPT/TIG domain-containing protein [Rathayibacter sp. AY1A4]PPF18267.1 hypothetical protein C5B92_07060 [Rathayibacter sp. AY1A4]